MDGISPQQDDVMDSNTKRRRCAAVLLAVCSNVCMDDMTEQQQQQQMTMNLLASPSNPLLGEKQSKVENRRIFAIASVITVVECS